MRLASLILRRGKKTYIEKYEKYKIGHGFIQEVIWDSIDMA